MSDENFVCECDESFISACEGLDFYREVDGKTYCVLHCPVQDKVDDFEAVLEQKLSSLRHDFRGVYFPVAANFIGVNFDGADFCSAIFIANATFLNAIFKNTTDFCSTDFVSAYFWCAKFEGKADFNNATFSGKASFIETVFGANPGHIADFRNVQFNAEADFTEAAFSANADFRAAKFSADAIFEATSFSANVDFSKAKIESALRIGGFAEARVFAEKASLNLERSQITKPEKVIFHTTRLHPHWFVDVDCRKFEFTNVNWVGLDKLPALSHPGRMRSIAYRQLATNAEDNNRYSEAAQFRFASMDARRLEKWRGWNIFTLEWWYWLVSGYGERIPRAAVCLLILLLSFSFLFTQVGFDLKTVTPNTTTAQVIAPVANQPVLEELPLPSFRDGLTYTLSAALFQRPEPKAHSFWAKLCVSLEMIFVPLQAALLALAVRRRFMR